MLSVMQTPKQHKKIPYLVYLSLLLIPSVAGPLQALSSVNEAKENQLEVTGRRQVNRALLACTR